MYVIFFRTSVSLALALFVVCVASRVHAQSREDSLLNILEHTDKKNQIEVLYELVKVTIGSDDKKAYTYALEGYDLSESVGDSLMMVKTGRAVGTIKVRFGQLDEAIVFFTKCLSIARRNTLGEQEKFLLNNLAIAYTYKSNYDKALDYNFQSLIIREEEGDKLEISISCTNIGLVYYKLGDALKALFYFNRALELRNEIKNSNSLDRLLINIGLCYADLNKDQQAIESIEQGFKLGSEVTSAQIFTEGHFALAQVYLNVNDYERSEQHFRKSFEIAKKIGNSRFMAESLMGIGSVNLKQNKRGEAFERLTQAEAMLDTLDYGTVKTSLYRKFATYYTHIGDLEGTARYQNMYIELRDSIMNDELIRNLAKVQTNFEERENLAIIAVKDEALEKQKRFNLAIIAIVFLAGLLVFVLYNSNLNRKRVNQALSIANVTIEDQNKQLTSLNKNLERMVDARTGQLKGANEALKRVNDELDNFIYKTSHDIRGPLATLKGMCNVAIMDVKDPQALEYFNKLDATAEKLNSILTRLLIINQINNSSAKQELINFEELVEDVLVTHRKRGLPDNLLFKREIDSDIFFYSDKGLIRIILENLIDNAIKFYNDSVRIDPFVEVRIKDESPNLVIRVVDNGIGIDKANPETLFQMFSRASERSDTGGIGLYLTKTAAEKIGGRIDFGTTAEGYTEFSVKFVVGSSHLRGEVMA